MVRQEWYDRVRFVALRYVLEVRGSAWQERYGHVGCVMARYFLVACGTLRQDW